MLELDALTKVFTAGTGAVRAVDGVSLSVERGELVSLLGPSGCGKTTTLRLIAGFETATSGAIRLAGRDVSRLPAQRRETGMVFQNYALFPHLDVFENVAFGLRTRGARREEIEERVSHALGLVDLEGFGPRRVQELSGGQQQRVALARALAPEPPLLLLDEPLSNLDAALRERTRVELRTLLKRLGMTAVFVTHDQDEAFALADRIALLNFGQLQQFGAPAELYHRPANPFVAGFIGRANFLPGFVRERSQDVLLVEVADGALWQAEPAAGFDPGQGDPVRVMVRPESLDVSEPAPDTATGGRSGGVRPLGGVVLERRFAGAYTAVMIDAGGVAVTAHVAGAAPGPDSRVGVLPLRAALAFPAS